MRLDPIVLLVRLKRAASIEMQAAAITGTLEVPDFYEIGFVAPWATGRQVMPDDHSELEPPLPIPNRAVKRLSADDSEHSLVKVGHRQANRRCKNAPRDPRGVFVFRSPDCSSGA